VALCWLSSIHSKVWFAVCPPPTNQWFTPFTPIPMFCMGGGLYQVFLFGFQSGHTITQSSPQFWVWAFQLIRWHSLLLVAEFSIDRPSDSVLVQNAIWRIWG
jgi:hypothetical protein